MKLISGLLTLLALIAFSTFSSADQIQSDLNICSVERERLEEKVITLESENESLKKKIEGSNPTSSRNTDQAEVNSLNDASTTTQEPIPKRKTTTETPTSTPAPDYPCGTLLDADTNDITVKGFLSGVYKDGSPLYPGVGNYPDFAGNRPARVYGNPRLALAACGRSELSTDQSVKFVASHPDLRWVWTDKSSVKKIVGHIPILKTSGQIQYITRHKLPGYQQIGFHDLNGVWYWKGAPPPVNSNDAFEVLVCQSTPGTTPAPPSPPSCTTCGELISFTSNNNPSNSNTAGFASGTWIDGSIVYPGVGDACTNNRVARISASFIGDGPGAYSPCGTIQFTSANVKYFCNHPKLTWVVGNQSTINSIPRKQIQVTANAQLAFIRLNVTKDSNVYQQIGYSWLNSHEQLIYWDGTIIKKNYPGNYEVLTCAP